MSPDLASLEDRARTLLATLITTICRVGATSMEAAEACLKRVGLAEAMMRRLICLRALQIRLPETSPTRPAFTDGQPFPPPADSAASEAPPCPRFRMIVPPSRQSQEVKPQEAASQDDWLPAALCPRVTLMDESARPGISPAPARLPSPAPQTPLDCLIHRMKALGDAFDRTDVYARRMARWLARQRAAQTGPVKAGPALPLGPVPDMPEDMDPLDRGLYFLLMALDHDVFAPEAPNTS
ncbi:hypothetical protein [Hyphomonas pacifica]|uniref:Uncharacterized protein n=1 Tax=Hyphomonas pacifica TaxID=1280941 RepID=A0A062TPX8_9PROT|nr:hypothetical protein [Hyphomonas pacifica]KCZ48844.1 hypothetical protein HY2_15770 [Hyphomonas pacifica]RAN31871.1 hypothetical protein HY3_16265 [Hyphomonas pacifica]